jgi:hypothetical protein
VFCPKTLLFVLLLPFFIGLSMPIHFFQLDLLASFQETLGPRFFGFPTGPFCAPTSFSFHFLWGGSSSFPQSLWTTYFGWYALIAPMIAIKFLSNHCLLLLEAIGANSFGLLPF